MRLTPAREKVIRHCLEFVFLYHLSDDKGKFDIKTVRSMHMGGILDKNFGGVDHDETCYELSELGFAWAKHYNLMDRK